ncbi:MAG: proteasome accessory factor PafA2 family protein [Pirellulaceae bacterium]|nr:proteasome accessory factor PafA2 family protein [Pirellulaceae bacterium]
MASKPGIFQRLIGLETEYALVVPQQAERGRSSRYGLFRDVVAALRRRLPLVPARHMKEGVFHAAGGAVWFETERPAVGGGLIEGATPECRSPRQLVAWQRAQDELLAEATAEASVGVAALVKNDQDAAGNVYGAQENYEATFAAGWRLWLWRAALVLLAPLIFSTWFVLWVLDRLVIVYALGATVFYLLAERLVREPSRLSHLLFGCDLRDLANETPTGPAWLEGVLAIATRFVTAPLAAVWFTVLWLTAFVPVRRQMLPFLISRPILSGSGLLDDEGNFHLADKAPRLNCVVGLGGFLRDRPIVSLGHIFKVVSADAGLVLGEYARLFSRRQRLQIALGDSNMCETAEYLRIGTTLLVLDCLEAGQLPRVPWVRSPLASLHAICADPSLVARVRLSGSGSATALNLQRFYLEACRRFVERQGDAPVEAREVLRRWEQTLDALADDPQSLVGSLDWVTKQFVLDKSGRNASWAARKKIDLRYHELTSAGYYSRLDAAGIVQHLVSRQEIEHARRNPPSGTPAAARGRYIREFAVDGDDVAANWRTIFLRDADGNRRRVQLDRYQSLTGEPSATPRRKARKGDASGG